MKVLTREGWLEGHAYLQPVGRVCAEIDRAVGAVGVGRAEVPSFDAYADEFREGVPLLQSARVAIDCDPAGETIVSLVRKLASDSRVESLRADSTALAVELSREPEAPRRIAAWLLGDEGFTPSHAGLLRFLGWTALARYLAPAVDAFGRWRDEDRWMRRYCPACGSLPAMAQLQGVDPGRLRFLCCGRCGSRWRYRRTQCPFCENDSQRLSVLAAEGEEGLRIDYCEACKGYLKTYNGEGNESVLLADWTSLHLDVAAHDRGLERTAASLFDLDPAMAG